jgi:hypothetical protein
MRLRSAMPRLMLVWMLFLASDANAVTCVTDCVTGSSIDTADCPTCIAMSGCCYMNPGDCGCPTPKDTTPVMSPAALLLLAGLLLVSGFSILRRTTRRIG